MNEFLALTAVFVAIWGTSVALLLTALAAGHWFISKLYDFFYPPDREEIARREAERVARQATKEFKRRQRMRAVRFWNL
jgi:hypothetical protein